MKERFFYANQATNLAVKSIEADTKKRDYILYEEINGDTYYHNFVENNYAVNRLDDMWAAQGNKSKR